MSQANLTPNEQQALFNLLKKAGQQPTSGGVSQDAPDQAAQAGVGSVDYNGLQQMFNPSGQSGTLQPQEGDQMHPMDAIQHIVKNVTGPQLVSMSGGRAGYVKPTDNPLLKFVGYKNDPQPVDTTNFYPALIAMGAEKFAPANTPMLPDGTPLITATVFKDIMAAKAALPTANNPGIDKATALGLGIPQKQADKLYGNDEVKTLPLTTLRLAGVLTAANASMTRSANQQLNTLMQYGGPGAAQQATQDAYSRLANLNRADGISNVIENMQGGKADSRQRALFITEVSRAINPSGVITNEALNNLASDSAAQKINDWKEWLTNTATPTQFDGFLSPLKELVSQEKSINQSLFSAGTNMGLGIIKGSNPSGAATAAAAIAANPIVNPKPKAPIKTASDYLKKFKR